MNGSPMLTPTRRRTLAVLPTLALIVAVAPPVGAGAPGGALAASSEPASGTGWAVVEERELDVEGELVALSPDGDWIAGVDAGEHLCVWETASLDARCHTDRGPVDLRSIVWAPDSSAVAWSLDTLVRFYDSDIFVLEVATGVGVNLTDDGFEGGLSLGDEAGGPTLPVDLYPAWTPDAEALVFARTEWNDPGRPTSLIEVDRAGGEPRVLHAFGIGPPLWVWWPMQLLDDGSVLYNVWASAPDDRDNGIWWLPPGQRPHQVMSGPRDSTYPHPVVADVGYVDGRLVLSGFSREVQGDAGVAAERSPSFLIDFDTGELEKSRGEFQTPLRFGPDGASTIGVTFTVTDGHLLVLVEPDGASTELAQLAGSGSIDRGVDWASNDTVLVTRGRDGATLFALDRSDGVG